MSLPSFTRTVGKLSAIWNKHVVLPPCMVRRVGTKHLKQGTIVQQFEQGMAVHHILTNVHITASEADMFAVFSMENS